jgi:hypothetical protein
MKVYLLKTFFVFVFLILNLQNAHAFNSVSVADIDKVEKLKHEIKPVKPVKPTKKKSTRKKKPVEKLLAFEILFY